MINSLKSKYYNYIILIWCFICHFFPTNLYFWIVFFYIMIAKEISKINFFFSISLNFKIFFLNCRNDFVSRWFLFFSFIKDSLRGSKLPKVHFEGFTARFPKSKVPSKWITMICNEIAISRRTKRAIVRNHDRSNESLLLW